MIRLLHTDIIDYVTATTRCRLEVFRTKKAGWGVRTLLPIQKGTFICELVYICIDFCDIYI